MSPELYRFKKRLIEQKNREAENQRMDAAETSSGDNIVFWVCLLLLSFYIMWVPR